MKIDDVIKKKFYLLMNKHGVKGVAIEVDNATVQDLIRTVRQEVRSTGTSKEVLQGIQENLAKNLTEILPDIARHGTAVDSEGNFYDRQTFDDDCVLCAVYDHIAYGVPIAITDNIGPRPGDKVH